MNSHFAIAALRYHDVSITSGPEVCSGTRDSFSPREHVFNPIAILWPSPRSRQNGKEEGADGTNISLRLSLAGGIFDRRREREKLGELGFSSIARALFDLFLIFFSTHVEGRIKQRKWGKRRGFQKIINFPQEKKLYHWYLGSVPFPPSSSFPSIPPLPRPRL